MGFKAMITTKNKQLYLVLYKIVSGDKEVLEVISVEMPPGS